MVSYCDKIFISFFGEWCVVFIYKLLMKYCECSLSVTFRGYALPIDFLYSSKELCYICGIYFSSDMIVFVIVFATVGFKH